MSNFIKQGNNIFNIPKGLMYDLEPGKVYDLRMRTSWGEQVTKFTLNGELNLPEKVLLTEKDKMFIRRVITNFNNTNKNTTGVILAGDKGTGKSVTATVLAKEANLPVIVIDPETEEKYIEPFFKSFDTPVCILFDEIDKNFDTNKLLTFLDGLQKTTKKLVIMTCNDQDALSSFIKNRCSRIRYYRYYDMANEAKDYADLICESKGIIGEEAEQVVKFMVDNINYPSIDNMLSFVEEYIDTKDWGLTLEEVLFFMNINVEEKEGAPITPPEKEEDSEEYELDGSL